MSALASGSEVKRTFCLILASMSLLASSSSASLSCLVSTTFLSKKVASLGPTTFEATTTRKRKTRCSVVSTHGMYTSLEHRVASAPQNRIYGPIATREQHNNKKGPQKRCCCCCCCALHTSHAGLVVHGLEPLVGHEADADLAALFGNARRREVDKVALGCVVRIAADVVAGRRWHLAAARWRR